MTPDWNTMSTPLPLLTFAPSSPTDLLILKDAKYTEPSNLNNHTHNRTSDAVSAHIQISKDILPPRDIAERLIALHFGFNIDTPLNMPDICNFYCFLSTRFESFAYSLDSFSSLTPNDRSVLLSSNTPLYFQYHLSNYVNADTGHEQISRLLNVTPSYYFENELVPLTNCDSQDFVLKVSLYYFVSICELFNDKTQVNLYEDLSENLKEIQVIPDTIHFIAEALLFFCRPDFRTSLDDPAFVQKKYDEALTRLKTEIKAVNLSKNCRQLFNTTKLQRSVKDGGYEPLYHTITHYHECVLTLNRLTLFYSQHGNICNFPRESASFYKKLELLDEDNFWETSEVIFKDFDSPFRSIDIGFNQSETQTLLSFTESHLLKIFNKRLLCILRKCLAFNELSIEAQSQIQDRNVVIALGILCLYLEGENDVYQQLNILLGKDEMHCFRNLISQEVKKFDFFAKSDFKLKQMIPYHQDVTKLIILCVLFQEESTLKAHYNFYRKLLEYRLKTMRNSLRNTSKEKIWSLIEFSESQRYILRETNKTLSTSELVISKIYDVHKTTIRNKSVI